MDHLFKGENKDELDIRSLKNSDDNTFRNVDSLSTGWTGTCPVLEIFSYLQLNYTSDISSLSTIISSNHQTTMEAYKILNTSIEAFFTPSNITATNPSGSTDTLIPKFEYEFSNRNNSSLCGGKIYSDFTKNLRHYIINQDANIRAANSLINNNVFKTIVDDTYSNFVKFDTAVATASNVMNDKILDLKDYFLTIQTFLMIFTWGYLILFVAIIVIYIIYLCEGNNILYIVLIILVNILFIIILLEFLIASFFVQVKFICHDIPRAINFIFTGTYMTYGNSGSYPAKFGRGDANMTTMFTTCLNGNGNLANLFISPSNLNDLNYLQTNEGALYNNLDQIINNSNLILKDYDSMENSIFIKVIVELEIMKNNLYLATEGFGDYDIYNILSTIRNNLDSENCCLTNEYYVIKDSDCPSGSTKSTSSIFNKTGEVHCYVIQKLAAGVEASYSGSSCNNSYINAAITFIKRIDSLLDTRLAKVKDLQSLNSKVFSNLYNEVYLASTLLNNTYSKLISNLAKASSIANCGSSKFDLIDFCDFIGSKTAYKAKIVLIFSSFLGAFGFAMLFFFLIVLNSFNENDYNDNSEEEGYNYYENYGRKRPIKNINIKVNKMRQSNKKKYYGNDDDEEEEEENIEYNNLINKNKNTNIPKKKGGQAMEMSLFQNNENEKNSSDES